MKNADYAIATNDFRIQFSSNFIPITTFLPIVDAYAEQQLYSIRRPS